MPIYVFQHRETGEVIEQFLTFSQHERRVRKGVIKIKGEVYEAVVTGGIMSRMSSKERGRSGPGSTYPMKSAATGVEVHQIPEAMAHDRENGLKVDYDPKTGDAIYTSRGQRKKHVESLGMYDRNGGYSDPQRKTTTQRPKAPPQVSKSGKIHDVE